MRKQMFDAEDTTALFGSPADFEARRAEFLERMEQRREEARQRREAFRKSGEDSTREQAADTDPKQS